MFRLKMIAILILVVSASNNPRAIASVDDQPFEFGQHLCTVNELDGVADVTFDKNGNALVVVAAEPRCLSIDSTGIATPMRLETDAFQIGRLVAIDADGSNVAAVDRHSNAVLYFHQQTETTLVLKAIIGQDVLRRPNGVALLGDAIVVADTGHNRIVTFDLDGNVTSQFGSTGTEDGQFNQPTSVALGPNGDVYVTDTSNSRIQQLSSDGTFIRTWGDYGPYIGLMDTPRGLTIHNERVIVADERNHRMQFFHLDGRLDKTWGQHARLPREAGGKLHYPAAIAIDGTNQIAVIVEPMENRVQFFARAAPDDPEIAPSPPFNRKNQTHFGHYASSSSNVIAIGEPELHSISIFRTDLDAPVVITTFGMRGVGPGRFINPSGIHLELNPPTLHVADPATGLIHVFALDFDPTEPLRQVGLVARLLRTIHLAERAGRPIFPSQLRRCHDGRWLMLDQHHEQLELFSSDWQPIKSLAVDKLIEPRDLVLIPGEEAALVVHHGSTPVVKVSFEGTVNSWGNDDDLSRPSGIGISANGDTVIITDEAMHQAVMFDRQGDVIQRIGGPGYHDVMFWKPGGVTFLEDGSFLINDQGNHRGQIFEDNGQWLASFGRGRPSTRARPRRYDD